VDEAVFGANPALANHPFMEAADCPASGVFEKTRYDGVNEASKPAQDHRRPETAGGDQVACVAFPYAARMSEEKSFDHRCNPFL
jgi:hypothetical protein